MLTNISWAITTEDACKYMSESCDTIFSLIIYYVSNHVLKVSSPNQLVSGYLNCDILHPSRQMKLQNIETAKQNLAGMLTSDRKVTYIIVENRGVVYSC